MGKSRINPGGDDDGPTTKQGGTLMLMGVLLFIGAFMAWVMSVTP